jgi:hypothetical protein
MGGIVGVLLVVYKLWIAPYYDFYEVQIWRFIEVNILPVIISLYLFFRKYLTTIVRNNQNG